MSYPGGHGLDAPRNGRYAAVTRVFTLATFTRPPAAAATVVVCEVGTPSLQSLKPHRLLFIARSS